MGDPQPPGVGPVQLRTQRPLIEGGVAVAYPPIAGDGGFGLAIAMYYLGELPTP
ncbi:hypothetical protein SGGMMB4_03195 [Sodalis glossinidius str. 'morsitans']|uniref:Uncharacterized protein n=1 Tax=Sodalis glossinidius (strain morsitans) TaxID=343509 RepID=A0A193QKK8_SODGM|nr:hypothetical protein SGGMMB4_03195 [Sodalis glossinidius str. 'morsitans']